MGPVIRRWCGECDRFTVSRTDPRIGEVCGEHWEHSGIPIWPGKPIVIPPEIFVALVANGRDNS